MAILLLVSAAPQIAVSQGRESPDYFPLEVGNWWRQAYVETYFSPPDTVLTFMHEVLGEVSLEGRSYFRLSRHLLDTNLVRSDSTGRIWGYRDGVEQQLLDFSAADDSIYFYPLGHPDPYEVRVRRNRTVQTLVGRFSDCVTFDFDVPNALDDQISFTFAPDVGLIGISGAWEFGTLLSAFVGGTAIVTAIEEVPRGDLLLVDAYPIPVEDYVQLDVQTTVPGLVTVSVYDALGRTLLADQTAQASVGLSSHAIDFTALASGLYFVRIRHQNGRTHTVVVPRQTPYDLTSPLTGRPPAALPHVD